MTPIIVACAVVVVVAGLAYLARGRGAPRPASPAPAPARPPGAPTEPVRIRSSPPGGPGSAPRIEVAGAVEIEIPVEEDAEEETGPQSLILVTGVGRTDPGLRRKHNEDAYLIDEKNHLFVIADGMGRQAAGEVASALAIGELSRAFSTGEYGPDPDDPALPRRANALLRAIRSANRLILEQSRDVDDYSGMGTTVVAAHFSPGKQRVYVAHAGDSRCYRLRAGAKPTADLVPLTRDHNLGAEGITGPQAAVLTRAVGLEEHLEIDLAIDSPVPGDIYLLCSDGLSRMVPDDRIRDTMAETRDLDEAARRLIALANDAGGKDNVTAILVRVDPPRVGGVHRQ